MENETPTNEAQTSEAHVTSEVGNEAATSADALTLAEINALTGKSYNDKETALKSIVDMSKQAGKASDLEGKLKEYEQSSSETPEAKSDSEVESLKKTVNQLTEDTFFAQNSDHAENKDLLKALASANNVPLAEAVELPAYKDVMDKIATAQPKRTIASSNNRVATTTEEAPIDDAIKSGDPLAMAKAVTDAFITK